jgi:hypothetical protein
MASRVVCAASAPVPIMVNDLTGKMGRAVADAVVARGADQCFLVPVALSGQAKDPVDVGGVEVEIRSVLDGDAGATLDELKSSYPGMIVVDYTLPAAVNANASLYVKHETPFVMGTTGGDREALADRGESVAAARGDCAADGQAGGRLPSRHAFDGGELPGRVHGVHAHGDGVAPEQQGGHERHGEGDRAVVQRLGVRVRHRRREARARRAHAAR